MAIICGFFYETDDSPIKLWCHDESAESFLENSELLFDRCEQLFFRWIVGRNSGHACWHLERWSGRTLNPALDPDIRVEARDILVVDAAKFVRVETIDHSLSNKKNQIKIKSKQNQNCWTFYRYLYQNDRNICFCQKKDQRFALWVAGNIECSNIKNWNKQKMGRLINL